MPETQANVHALADDHELLFGAVKRAGEIARALVKTEFKTWNKAKGSPVTDVDLAIDASLKKDLLVTRPTYGWLSEETEDDPDRLAKANVWVVDPIDGTKALVSGHPHFTICAALTRDGRPVSAVVYNPSTDDLYEARIDKGAKWNGRSIMVSDRTDLDGCRMLGDRQLFQHPAWRRPWPEMHIESRSSIALRMVMVATGEWDGCLTLSGKSDWDLAAADLIVSEAGGLVTDHQGKPFLYNRSATRHPSLIVGGAALHGEIKDRVQHIDLTKPRA